MGQVVTESRVVDAGGIGTAVLEAGTGKPVLLVHGSGPGASAAANWRLTLPALAERFHVVAPDVVGFGVTERPDGFAYTRATWTQHLVDLLDALGLETVSVVGNSFGGGMALSLADTVPERVDRLVLMGSTGTRFPLSPELDRLWGFDARGATAADMRAVFETFVFDPARVTDELVETRLADARAPGAAETFVGLFPAPREQAIAALALDEDRLRAITHPTLVVHGREDRVIPLSASLDLLRLLPNADLIVAGRCGHWVQVEAHDRFVSAVADFLA